MIPHSICRGTSTTMPGPNGNPHSGGWAIECAGGDERHATGQSFCEESVVEEANERL